MESRRCVLNPWGSMPLRPSWIIFKKPRDIHIESLRPAELGYHKQAVARIAQAENETPRKGWNNTGMARSPRCCSCCGGGCCCCSCGAALPRAGWNPQGTPRARRGSRPQQQQRIHVRPEKARCKGRPDRRRISEERVGCIPDFQTCMCHIL